MVYRWIMYLEQPVWGGCKPERVTSLSEAVNRWKEFRAAMGDPNGPDGSGVRAMLYPYRDDDWQDCVEMYGIGNPLDYPDKVINRGPRGGAVFSNV